MKRLLLILAAVGMIFTACEDSEPSTPKIELSQQYIEVDCVPNTYTISVTSPYSWKAESDNDWIIVESKTGIAGTEILSFSVKNNKEETVRKGTITVMNSTYNIATEFYITQKAFSPTITIDNKELSFNIEGGEQIVKIAANVDYDIISNADWVKYTKSNSGITIKVSALDFTPERTADIVISNEKYGISEVIKIVQEAQNPQCLIYYTTTTNNSKIEPYTKDAFGANIISNSYKNGQGVIAFDAPITSIGYKAFYDCSSLKSITIPDSVTSIGNSAFIYCSSLTSVTIPDSVTSIEAAAFAYCSSLTAFYGKYASADNRCLIIDGILNSFASGGLTSYTIPDCVTSIGEHAFNSCNSLKSITIPNSVTSIGRYAFQYCSSLTSVTIPNSVKSIGSSAFNWCSSLISITIPDSVTSIGDYAFEGCSSLTSVTIGNSVTSIGDDAFYNCSSLARVDITDLSAWCKIDFDGSSANPLFYAKNLYLNGKLVTELTIPSDITEIKRCTFSGCNSLTSITIPDSVTSIGNSAFIYCSSLTSVTIPDSVTSIEAAAFAYCSSLTAFYGKYASTDNRCLIIDGVLKAFARAGLTSYTIPDSVTSIGDDAFFGCSSLTSVTIPDSVTSIGLQAFCYCSSLTSITIPNSVTSIGGAAFGGCSSLTSITIPDSVTSIGLQAFCYCSSLTSVTIPDSVTSIGNEAFFGCSRLTSVYCKAPTPPSGGNNMFSDNASGRKIYVPTALVEAYKSAERWSYYASDIVGYDF